MFYTLIIPSVPGVYVPLMVLIRTSAYNILSVTYTYLSLVLIDHLDPVSPCLSVVKNAR